MSTLPPPSPELIRLKRQAVKRFHPDNAIDTEDEIRLTKLMQDANAAFDARDEAALRAVFNPPRPPQPPSPRPPQAPPNAWGPRAYAGANQSSPPPPAQPNAPPAPSQSQQGVSAQFKNWFWFTLLPFIVLWVATDAVKAWDAAGIPVLVLITGVIVSLIVAANRVRLSAWFKLLGWFRYCILGLSLIAIGYIGIGIVRGSGFPHLPVFVSSVATITAFLCFARLIFKLDQWIRGRMAQAPPLVNSLFKYRYPLITFGTLTIAGIVFIAILVLTTPSHQKVIPLTPVRRGGATWVGCTQSDLGLNKHDLVLDTQNEIAKHVTVWPEKGLTGIRFKMYADGSVHDIVLDYPSGVAMRDVEAMRAITGAAPFAAQAKKYASEFYGPAEIACYFSFDSKDQPTVPNCLVPHDKTRTATPLKLAHSSEPTMQTADAASSPLIRTDPAEAPVSAAAFPQRYPWYVEQIKSRVAQQWRLSEVSKDTPAGATAYIRFTINRMGHPSNATLDKTSALTA